MQILAGAEADAICAPAGVAYAVTGLLRTLPLQIARRQFYLPAALLDEYGASFDDLSAGRSSPSLDVALRELRAFARRNLQKAREQMVNFLNPPYRLYSRWRSLDLRSTVWKKARRFSRPKFRNGGGNG